MTDMHFGFMKLTRIPYSELKRDIQEAEAMGFDSAWIDDDLFSPEYADFEIWSVLGALAAQTERIRLGSLVTVPTFRQPAVLAAHALTIDHISNGRIEIGLGAGGAKESYPAIGVEPWTPRERSERLQEYAAIVSHMLRGESIDYSGRYYSVAVDQVIPPIQKPRPPLSIAAHGERGLRTVARYADGWNTLVGIAGPGVDDPKAARTLAEAVANLNRLSERLDRDLRGRRPRPGNRAAQCADAPAPARPAVVRRCVRRGHRRIPGHRHRADRFLLAAAGQHHSRSRGERARSPRPRRGHSRLRRTTPCVRARRRRAHLEPIVPNRSRRHRSGGYSTTHFRQGMTRRSSSAIKPKSPIAIRASTSTQAKTNGVLSDAPASEMA